MSVLGPPTPALCRPSSSQVEAQQILQPDELNTARIYMENKDSVVFIIAFRERWDPVNFVVLEEQQGYGTGFVWSDDGVIVTNFHVISGANKHRVTLANNSTYDAKFVGSDPNTDVAVMHIRAPKDVLRAIPVGKSAGLLVGQKVYAIGHPLGLNHTLTTGVISSIRRTIFSAATGHPIHDVIQIDAAINPGNSGGPLLDSSGNLIGINTAGYLFRDGLAFSIPVDTVAGVVDEVLNATLADHITYDANQEESDGLTALAWLRARANSDGLMTIGLPDRLKAIGSVGSAGSFCRLCRMHIGSADSIGSAGRLCRPCQIVSVGSAGRFCRLCRMHIGSADNIGSTGRLCRLCQIVSVRLLPSHS